MRRSLMVFALAVPPHLLAAQAELQSVVTGDRVRVAWPGRPPVIGTLRSIGPDSILVEPAIGASSPVSLARTDLSYTIEKTAGVKNHALKGGLIGAGIGALFTVYFLTNFCGGDNLCNGDEEAFATAVFVLPPAAVGAVIGALTRSERWVAVDRSRLGLAIGWNADRVTAGFRLRFGPTREQH